DGAIWIGTDEAGLFHAHADRVDGFGRADGLSGDRVFRIFEDREGSIWVSTLEGLDRFRPLPAVTYSARQGLSGVALSVLAEKEGMVPLARWALIGVSPAKPFARTGFSGVEAATCDQRGFDRRPARTWICVAARGQPRPHLAGIAVGTGLPREWALRFSARLP